MEAEDQSDLELKIENVDSQELVKLIDFEYINAENLPNLVDCNNLIHHMDINLPEVQFLNEYDLTLPEFQLINDTALSVPELQLPDDTNLSVSESQHPEDHSDTENKSMDISYNMGNGWRPIEEYFFLFQEKIRMEKNLFKYIKIENHIYGIFFYFKEKAKFSTEEILLAIELFSRLVVQDFTKKIGECCVLQKNVQLNEEKWALSIQQFNEQDFLSIVTCLILAKKLYDCRFTISSTIIKELLTKSGKEVTLQDLVQHELKVLEELNYNVNAPLLSTYCNLLYEMVQGDQFGVARQAFYEASSELYKIYFLNIDEINYRQEESFSSNIECIAVGILCAVFYQCSAQEEKCIPSLLLEILECLTNLKKDIIIRLSLKLIEFTINL